MLELALVKVLELVQALEQKLELVLVKALELVQVLEPVKVLEQKLALALVRALVLKADLELALKTAMETSKACLSKSSSCCKSYLANSVKVAKAVTWVKAPSPLAKAKWVKAPNPLAKAT